MQTICSMHASCQPNKKYQMFVNISYFMGVLLSDWRSTNQLFLPSWLGSKKSWISWQPYLTYGTWQNWVTQHCTQGFAGPCTRGFLPRHVFMTQTLPLGTKFQSLDNFLSYLRGVQWFIKIWKLELGLRERWFQFHPNQLWLSAALWAVGRDGWNRNTKHDSRNEVWDLQFLK